MKIARSALSVTVLDCKIYAMGGYDGQNFLANVEVYDPVKDQWEDGDPLTSGRSGHASAVCYQTPCPSNFHMSSASDCRHNSSSCSFKHSSSR